MYIYASFLPPEQFHKVTWVCVDDSPWWYYIPKQDIHRLEKGKEFFDTVDKNIRNLVKFLNGRGYMTTPSCAGHFRPKSYYSRIYAQLIKDQEAIRNQHVTLKTANQEVITTSYQDPSYFITWPTKELFIEEALKNQTIGVLGIVEYTDKIYKAALAKGIECKRDGNVTLLLETSKTKERKKEGWDRIGSMIVDAIV